IVYKCTLSTQEFRPVFRYQPLDDTSANPPRNASDRRHVNGYSAISIQPHYQYRSTTMLPGVFLRCLAKPRASSSDSISSSISGFPQSRTVERSAPNGQPTNCSNPPSCKRAVIRPLIPW